MKNFLTDNDLYTTDCAKILSLHKLLQKINVIVAVLEVISGLIACTMDEEYIIALPVAIVVALVTLFINRLVLNVAFGWLYDVRALRMNAEKNANPEA